MPTYEYQCGDCQHAFETLQSINEKPLSQCPRCERPTLQRVIGRTSFVLQGGGWAKDLYGSRKSSK